MKSITQPFYAAMFIASFLFSGCGNNSQETAAPTETPKQIQEPVKPKEVNMSEDEAITFFQAKWDSVTLKKEEGFPQYKTYMEQLQSVTTSLQTILEKDPNFTYDSPSKINKFRLKLIDSKKMKEATKNYLVYGQPMSKFELQETCESFLRNNLNDPSSFDADGFKMMGQTKKGWLCAMQYRAKNGYGALVLQQTTFDIKFDAATGYFSVSDAN